MISHAQCGCGYGERGRCSICDACAMKAWEGRESRGQGHARRTVNQAPRETRERERVERQQERVRADREALKK